MGSFTRRRLKPFPFVFLSVFVLFLSAAPAQAQVSASDVATTTGGGCAFGLAKEQCGVSGTAFLEGSTLKVTARTNCQQAPCQVSAMVLWDPQGNRYTTSQIIRPSDLAAQRRAAPTGPPIGLRFGVPLGGGGEPHHEEEHPRGAGEQSEQREHREHEGEQREYREHEGEHRRSGPSVGLTVDMMALGRMMAERKKKPIDPCEVTGFFQLSPGLTDLTGWQLGLSVVNAATGATVPMVANVPPCAASCCCVTSGIVFRNTTDVPIKIRLDTEGGQRDPVVIEPGQTHTAENVGESFALSLRYTNEMGTWSFGGHEKFSCKELRPGPLPSHAPGFPGLEIVSIEKGPCEKACPPPEEPSAGAPPEEPSTTPPTHTRPRPEEPHAGAPPEEPSTTPPTPPIGPTRPRPPPGPGTTTRPPPGPGTTTRPPPGPPTRPRPSGGGGCLCEYDGHEWQAWETIGAEYVLLPEPRSGLKLPLEGGQIPLKALGSDRDRLVLKANKWVFGGPPSGEAITPPGGTGQEAVGGLPTGPPDPAMVTGEAAGGIVCKKEKRMTLADRVYVSWSVEGPAGKAGRFSNRRSHTIGESVIYTPGALEPGDDIRITIATQVSDSDRKGDDTANRARIKLRIRRPSEPEKRYLLVDTESVEPFAPASQPDETPEPECDCEIKTTWEKGLVLKGWIDVPEDGAFLCANRLYRFNSNDTDADDLLIRVTHPLCPGQSAKIQDIIDVMRNTWGAKVGTYLGRPGQAGSYVVYKPPDPPPDAEANERITLNVDDMADNQYDDKNVSDRKEVTVIKVDLVLFKPDGSEIPEESEEEAVGFVWRNRDNDDNDDKYDNEDTNVGPLDDELVKVRLDARPHAVEKRVRLKATEGGSLIKLWTDPHKGSEVALPATYSFGDLPKELYLEGVKGSAALGDVGLVLECVDDKECRDEVRLTVLDIKKLSWVGKNNSVSDTDELDEDPVLPWGFKGQRVFPGGRKGSPNRARDTVKVKVALNVEVPEDVDVHLRAFDVDDPSSDFAPVDDPFPPVILVFPYGIPLISGTDNQMEEDNRGDVGGKKSGKIEGEDADQIKRLSFEKGEKEKEVDFRVTMQPGDNFRIAASNDRDLMPKLRNKDDEDGVDIHNKVPPASAGEYKVVTPILTVWRMVHVEVDSMGPVKGNEEHGMVVDIWPGSWGPGTTDVVADKKVWGGRRFVPGTLTVEGRDYSVVQELFNSLVVNGKPPKGKPFTLVDDDKIKEGQDVPDPDTSHLEAAFARAYVLPKIKDVGDSNDNVPFELNVLFFSRSRYYDFDARATEASNTFWTIYLLGSYQPWTDEDGDPNSEDLALGVVDRINGQGAHIFKEMPNEVARWLKEAGYGISLKSKEAGTVIHEVGHLFNALHEDGGIMSHKEDLDNDFSDITINKIRSIDHP